MAPDDGGCLGNVPVKNGGFQGKRPALGVADSCRRRRGIYSSVAEACRKVIKTNPAQAPIPENTGRYEEFYRIYRGLYPQLKDCIRRWLPFDEKPGGIQSDWPG